MSGYHLAEVGQTPCQHCGHPIKPIAPDVRGTAAAQGYVHTDTGLTGCGPNGHAVTVARPIDTQSVPGKPGTLGPEKGTIVKVERSSGGGIVASWIADGLGGMTRHPNPLGLPPEPKPLPDTPPIPQEILTEAFLVQEEALAGTGAWDLKISPNPFDDPLRQDHYRQIPGIQCVDVVKHFPYLRGSAIACLWRAGLKPGTHTIEDLDKAMAYIREEIAMIQEEDEAGK